MSKIPVKTLNKLKEKLPNGYAQVLVDRLAEQNIDVSGRLVQMVLAGDREDHNGIINEAIALAKEEEEKQQQVIDQIEGLDKK